jgi:hypothetical protein
MHHNSRQVSCRSLSPPFASIESIAERENGSQKAASHAKCPIFEILQVGVTFLLARTLWMVLQRRRLGASNRVTSTRNVLRYFFFRTTFRSFFGRAVALLADRALGAWTTSASIVGEGPKNLREGNKTVR